MSNGFFRVPPPKNEPILSYAPGTPERLQLQDALSELRDQFTDIPMVIGGEEVCVQDIVEAVGTSQSNISQHLAILRDKDVLLTRKDANRVYYRVGDPRTLQLIAMMREVFCSDDD